MVSGHLILFGPQAWMNVMGEIDELFSVEFLKERACQEKTQPLTIEHTNNTLNKLAFGSCM